jgi:hypothetical protein
MPTHLMMKAFFLLKMMVTTKGVYRTETGCIQWTDSTQSWPSASVTLVYRGSQWGETKRSTQYSQRLFPTECFMLSFFLKLCSCWWKRQTDITTNTWTYLMKDGHHCLIWPYRTCTCFCLLLCRWVMTRDRLENYWSRLKQFFMAFYGNTMKWDRICHIREGCILPDA